MSVRVAIVGAGAWGRNHVRTFANLEGAKLTAVCDKRPAVLDAMRGGLPDTKFVSETEEALALADAVVVATDAPSHVDVALQALRADKDVLVEKPLALSSADALKLCQEADARGRMLMVGHLLLYHPAIEALRAIIDSGELGEVLYVVCRRLNLGVVRQRENAWWSLAPHDLSIARYLLGSDPVAVAANGGTFLQDGIEDVVFGTVRFGQKQLAHIHVSWLDPHKVRSLTVVGSKKMAVFDDTSPDQKLVLFDKGVERPPAAVSYAEGVRIRTGDIRIPAIRMAEPLKRECGAFIDAVQSRKPPIADGRSGLAVVRALEAGARSLEQGGVEVAIQTGE
ncbi:MAG: Gfo/Idh/MocA family protein [Polyangiales bacterium]